MNDIRRAVVLSFCVVCAALLLCSALPCFAVSASPNSDDLTHWRAGAIVTAEEVDAFGGLDACFVDEPIPDAVWARMQGKTYKENPYIGRSDLRYIRALHWDYDGKTHYGEMVCNRIIAQKLIRIFMELYRQHYPIQKIRLADEYDADDEKQMRDNNTSCFCFRTVSGRHRC